MKSVYDCMIVRSVACQVRLYVNVRVSEKLYKFTRIYTFYSFGLGLALARWTKSLDISYIKTLP